MDAIGLRAEPRSPSLSGRSWALIQGDVRDELKRLPDVSLNCCVTSPPYWGLRDYGVEGQLGLEQTPDEYVNQMVEVFREVRRVLCDDGTLWLNLGDSYARTGGTDRKVSASARVGSTRNAMVQMSDQTSKAPSGLKDKDIVGIPWRVAFALQADGWYLRQDIIWHKPNPMPESVTDRCTKSHEYIFLLSKSPRYFFDADAIAEPAIHAGRVITNNHGKNSQLGDFGATRSGFMKEGGVVVKDTRNRRSVWTVTTKPFKGAHFATFPEDLILPCVLAGCPEGGVVLDPFTGSGTTGAVAVKSGRRFVGIEINPEYVGIAESRIGQAEERAGLFA